MKRFGINTIIGTVMILFSIYWSTIIDKLPKGTKLAAYGPGFFPTLVVRGLIIVSVLLIIQDYFNKNEKLKFILEKKDGIKVLILAIVLVIYLLAMPVLGYVISTIIVLFITLLLFGLSNKKALVIVSVLFPIAANVIFQTLLKVGLP